MGPRNFSPGSVTLFLTWFPLVSESSGIYKTTRMKVLEREHLAFDICHLGWDLDILTAG